MSAASATAAEQGIQTVGGRVSGHLVDRVRTRLASAPTRLTAPAILEALRAEGCLLDGHDLLSAAEQVRSELTGAGVLDQFLTDPEVTDVLVNAPDQVWVERSGKLVRTSAHFPDEAAVRRLAQRLAAQAGRRLDDAAPCVDAVLPGGARLHAVLPPIAASGTLISLRVPPHRAFSVEELTTGGMLNPDGARLLRALVASRVSFLISGGTGSGKTTLLGVALGLVPDDERIVVAEECTEIVCRHPHVVRLQGRTPNQEGVGGVGLRTLVRQALRMRPDRVVVGEVRGLEVCDLLTALNTGHDGGCATIHANGVEEVPARVEALALPSGIGRASLHAQLAAGVRVVVHLARDRGGARRLASVGVLIRDSDGWVRVIPAMEFGADGESRRGPGAERLDWLLGMRCGSAELLSTASGPEPDGPRSLAAMPEPRAELDGWRPASNPGTHSEAHGGQFGTTNLALPSAPAPRAPTPSLGEKTATPQPTTFPEPIYWLPSGSRPTLRAEAVQDRAMASSSGAKNLLCDSRVGPLPRSAPEPDTSMSTSIEPGTTQPSESAPAGRELRRGYPAQRPSGSADVRSDNGGGA